MSNLTQRELNSIEERLAEEQLMVRKFKMYSKICTDPQLQQKCEQVAARHQEHYLRLLNTLS